MLHTILAALLVVLAACGSKAPPAPNANTVALTLGVGIDPALDEEVREAFATKLAEAGFEVGTDSNAAAISLVLDLRSTKQRPGMMEGSSSWRVEAVVHAKTPSGSEDLQMHFVREAMRGMEVALWAKRIFIDELSTRLVAWLVMRPEMAAEVERLSRKKTRENLVFTRQRAEMRAAAEAKWNDYCRSERERLAEMDKVSGLVCVGDPCSQWTPVGLSADGQTAYVQENKRVPRFQIQASQDGGWVEVPEVLLRVPLVPDGKPETMYETANLYGFANTSGDGATLAVSSIAAEGRIAFARVDAKTGAVVGAPFVLGAEQRAGFAYPLADGMLVGLDPMLVAGATRTELPGIERVWQLREGFVGIHGDGRLVRYDKFGKERGSMTLEQTPDDIIDGGNLIYVVEHSGDTCNLLHVGGDPLAIQAAPALETCIDDGQPLGDGRIVAIADASRSDDIAGGDNELVVVVPATGRVTALTRDTYDHDALHAAGQRLVFGRQLPDFPSEHDLRIYRRQICWLDVPAAAQ